MNNKLTINDFEVFEKVLQSNGYKDNIFELHDALIKFVQLGIIIQKEDNMYYPSFKEEKSNGT